MAMPMTSHTTYSAGSLRRRTVAVPVARSACSIQLRSRLCANSEKLASELAVADPPANNAAATSIAAPFRPPPGYRAAFYDRGVRARRRRGGGALSLELAR